MFRYLRALWLFMTGRFAAAAEVLQQNRYVMEATYDASIKKTEERYHALKDALANEIRIEESKKNKIVALSKECEALSETKEGSAAKGRAHAQALVAHGTSTDQIKVDSEVVRCKTRYEEVVSTLSQKETEIHRLEDEIKQKRATIEKHKTDLQAIQRNRSALEQEKGEAVADVAAAREEEETNNMLSGMAQDSTDKDLAAARKARENAKARAKVSSELAGADATRTDDEFRQFAKSSKSSSEFDALLGLDNGQKVAQATEPAKLPEQ